MALRQMLILSSLTKPYYSHIPLRALAFQKRYIRRHMRRPREMTTRAFAARVAELNAFLLDFSPFDVNQDLDDSEIMDILENGGSPKIWSCRVLTLWKAQQVTLLPFASDTSLLRDL
jgi:hypothetical protein